jgi:hypothetical protein
MATSNLLLSTGERVEVDGPAEDVERLLLDAARSTPGTLAWLDLAGGGGALGVNPKHVVTLVTAEE